MTDAPLQEFQVESFNTDPEGRSQQSDVCMVFAHSPKAAAMKALSEDLHEIGNVRRLRARVTGVDAVGRKRVTALYSQL
ncbi:hypothetical protein [Devosia aurantiaca]|uniref:Uncharacterized protein n=1 Tax=Devosia aurantiaca TaxID=2714858 RepID=A0A6M1SQH7_9HYPH|nr:hypothetical protein [Devosia aurantiaca]NGP18904.1 hypothetical protein [Devosia aurantiaca]